MRVEFNVVYFPEQNSVRQLILEDKSDMLHESKLEIVKSKSPTMRIRAIDRSIPGTISVLWDKSSCSLVCYGKSKGDNTPYELIGMFIGYLMDYTHSLELEGIIRVVNIFPPLD